MIKLTDYTASDFGKVAVLMGGHSAERIISLESGQAVLNVLSDCGIDAHGIDFNKGTLLELTRDGFDRAFIVLHGRGGEDGCIQGALESIAMPYTGSQVPGSALAMDKLLSKAVWRDAGLPTPAAVRLRGDSNGRQIVDQLRLPIMVKPVSEGSSLGASKVTGIDKLAPAWSHANQYDEQVMAESWIEGNEYTVAVLNDTVLPIIKLETGREFYDYKAKYEDADTHYICPCGLDPEAEHRLGELSLNACRVLRVTGWARVDLMVDNANQAWLIELNTVPGMTSHSLVPMAAKQAGISFEQLVLEILASSMCEMTVMGSKT